MKKILFRNQASQSMFQQNILKGINEICLRFKIEKYWFYSYSKILTAVRYKYTNFKCLYFEFVPKKRPLSVLFLSKYPLRKVFIMCSVDNVFLEQAP